MKKLTLICLTIMLVFNFTAYSLADEHEQNHEQNQEQDYEQEDLEGIPEDIYQQELSQLEENDLSVNKYYRAKVLAVENIEIEQQHTDFVQRAEVLITNGPYQGEVHTVENPYREDHFQFNTYLEEEMRIIVLVEERDETLQAVELHTVARDRNLIYLLALFVITLLLVGGFHGFKNIIILSYTVFIILQVMMPLLLSGYSPVNIAILSTIIIIVPMLLVVGGANLKSLAAILGTSIGVILAGIIALIVGRAAALTGFSSDGAEIIAIMDSNIDLQGLLFAGIIIGSLGAIADVCMSIASAVFEIKKKNPYLDTLELASIGLEIGRDRMETRANILLLAYVGSAIPLMLLFASAKTHWLKIINMDLIVTEVVRGLAGSIGLIISIPITALIAGIIINLQQD